MSKVQCHNSLFGHRSLHVIMAGMKKEKNFTELIEELEAVVNRLEEEETTLENSINYYKKGIDLSHQCYEKLRMIEQQVRVVTDESGTPAETFISREGEEAQPGKKTRKQETKVSLAKEENNVVIPGLFETKEGIS